MTEPTYGVHIEVADDDGAKSRIGVYFPLLLQIVDAGGVAGRWRAVPSANQVWALVRVHHHPYSLCHVRYFDECDMSLHFGTNEDEDATAPLATAIAAGDQCIAFQLHFFHCPSEEGLIEDHQHWLVLHVPDHGCGLCDVGDVPSHVEQQDRDADAHIDVVNCRSRVPATPIRARLP